MHLLVEKIDRPYGTTETKPTGITERTMEKTTAVFNEGETKWKDIASKVAIGGVLLLSLIVNSKYCN